MAHELAQTETGEYLYAYKGEPPWHANETNAKLLPDDASCEDVCNAAGFESDLETYRVRFIDKNDEEREDDKNVVVFDPLTKKSLGVVSSRFKIHQRPDQRDLACKISRALDGTVDSAGIIFDGAGSFINIRVGKTQAVVKGDNITTNFLVCSFNDGTMATQGRGVETRVVCNNTLRIALGEGRAADFKISHRQEFDINRVFALWQEMHEAHKTRMEQFRMLSQTPVTMQKGEELVFNLFNSMREESKRQKSMEEKDEGQRDLKNRRNFKEIMELFDGGAMGSDIPGVKGTAWGLLNSVTEWVDWWSARKTDSHRFDDAIFGKGAATKDAAFQQFLSFAQNQNGILVPETADQE